MKAALMLAVALAAVPVPARAELPPLGVTLAACDADARAKLNRREPTSIRALIIGNAMTVQEAETVAAVCAIYEQGVIGGIRLMTEPRA